MDHHSDSFVRLRRDAVEMFRAGVDAADPRRLVRGAIDLSTGGSPRIAGQALSPTGILRVVAFGKAGVSMAEEVSALLPEEVFPGPGVVAVNKENHAELDRFRVFASGHPVPDEQGVAAATAIRGYLIDSDDEDTLLVLVSGGGSALLPAPSPGISLEDKMETTRLLLACGAPIQEINTVRKHLSTLKGGGLARLGSPSRVLALILSDVIGDDLSSIASGCTVPDPSTFADMAHIVSSYDLLPRLPQSVRRRLQQGLEGGIADTPKVGDPIFDRVTNLLVGSNSQSLAAVERRAAELGYRVLTASAQLCGEARAAAATLASTWRQVPDKGPLAIVAGGETTVTLRGDGKGGRNQELALAFALELESRPPGDAWVLLSGGTDGRDGPTDAGGGLVDSGTIERLRRRGIDPRRELERNNSYVALKAAADLLMTGPTGTNVADLQILLVEPAPQGG